MENINQRPTYGPYQQTMPNTQTAGSSVPTYTEPVTKKEGSTMKSTLSILLIAGSIIVLTIVGYMQSQKYIKQQAIDGCLQAGRVTFTKDGKNITTSEEYWYNDCMNKKGFTK